MIGKELIGRESESVVLKIRLEEVRRFAEGIGIPFNGEVPVTYIGTLLHADIPGLELTNAGMIHGEQKIAYRRSLSVGDSLTYKRRIKDVHERTSMLEKIMLVVLETTGYDLTGELVFSCSSTLITPVKGNKCLNNYQVSDRGPIREWEPNHVQIRQFAEASGDFNPIYLDDTYARQVGLEGMVAHGTLTMGQLEAMLTEWIGKTGRISKLNVRFEQVVRPGDKITFCGSIRLRTEKVIVCDIVAYNKKEEIVLSGLAHIVN
ncbi:MaoC family dehydratase N-terminal domain-containing protein [Desulfosporosinus sp.]|uniref:MaoC family dehydratase n=1 Tax=Desulfosporosinus sp. TaxID=157907 RepID=UPI0025C7097B|nr:MaoC family dehydratase N-terminal domain-containing protein [Desulfosporosinus sp.]